MRRMYSEQELTKVIKEVFDAEIASGAFDEKVSDAVDAYLVENPVDITALEGQDVELASLDASGLITGGEIVEKMSGYSYGNWSSPVTPIYAGAVKNGNKLTLVIFGKINAETPISTYGLGEFNLPSAVLNKIYPYTLDGNDRVVSNGKLYFYDSLTTSVAIDIAVLKYTGKLLISTRNTNLLTGSTDYYFRFEQTYLLSDTLVPEE